MPVRYRPGGPIALFFPFFKNLLILCSQHPDKE